MTKWMIRGVLAASLLVFGLQGQAQAQVSESTVEAVGFVGAVTDNLGTTFGGGMHFGSRRLIFSAEVGYLTLEGQDTSGLSIDLDANYLFPLANRPKLTPYILGGLGILRFNVSVPGDDISDTDTGLNLGGGLRYQAGANWGIRPEVKFLVHDDTATRFTIGVYYSFGN
ncbi:MAG: outer membrane beta-barrel protein [Vicinamibacterales bacterium]